MIEVEGRRGLEYGLKRIEQLTGENTERVVEGRFSTFDVYQRMCGVVQGLRMAKAALEEVLTEWEQAQERES